MSGCLPRNASRTASARVPSDSIGERLSAAWASASLVNNRGKTRPDPTRMPPAPAALNKLRRVIIASSLELDRFHQLDSDNIGPPHEDNRGANSVPFRRQTHGGGSRVDQVDLLLFKILC